MADKKKNIEAIYSLSPMQQGMVFHSLYAPESGAYFEQFSCELHGALNIEAFERAWNEVVRRQPALRTSFVWKRLDRMLQIVQKEVDLPLFYEDWRDSLLVSSPNFIEEQMATYLAADRARGFDLSKPPLMRLALFQIAGDRYLFVWSHHHALMDGWSMPLLLKEVLAYYDSFAQGKPLALPLPRPYKDYIGWLQDQDLEAAEDYWRGLLRGLIAPTPLVVDKQNGPEDEISNRRNEETEIHLSLDYTNRLGALARRERITLSTLLQAAWSILLNRYSGEQDILFGTTVSGRPADLPGAETMIGLFINTLPVRVNIPPNEKLSRWLQKLQAQSVETRQYEYCGLTQIQEWSEIPRGIPLFESILVFENYPVGDALKNQIGGKQLSIEDFRSYEQTNYPLTIVSGPASQLGIKASYDPIRFDRDTIQRMMGHLKTILEGIVDAGNLLDFEHFKIVDLPLLTNAEIHVLDDFSRRSSVSEAAFNQYSKGFNIQSQMIHELFEAQALRTPNTIALVLDQVVNGKEINARKMSYSELNNRADRLAQELNNHLGRMPMIEPGSFVGIYVERSFEMIIGILGVLKAGAAYLPLDPSYPADRLSYMLEDTQASLVLTQSHLLPQLARVISASCRGDTELNKFQIVVVDSTNPFVNNDGKQTLQKPSDPGGESKNLAYIIYTSGSTGRPKGVTIEHRSLANHAINCSAAFEINSETRMLQFISLGFDASAEEIFPTLINGATLVLPGSPKEMTTQEFLELADRQSITHLHLPVAFWHQCVDDMVMDGLSVPSSVQTLVAGGESPSVDKVRKWFELAPKEGSGSIGNLPKRPLTFINVYGPTEATIASTYYKIKSDDHTLNDLKRMPIGQGLVNNRTYILDRSLKPVPLGVPGELCIGGAGVARGYLNQESLSIEKFVEISGLLDNREVVEEITLTDRIYRTGDIARYLPDGNIEFIGRLDEQVKIRGFRIELGEIEAVLKGHLQVQNAAVIVRDDLQSQDSSSSAIRRLIAYVVPEKSKAEEVIDPVILRKYLAERLPDYMVPATFVILDSLPMTPNGKIDRRALPLPDGSQLGPENRYVAPRDPVESLIAGVWEQVLGVSHVGINDNFFDLGGHSLLATQVISRLRNVFQVDIPIRDLFESLTVASLARRITDLLQADSGIEQPPIEQLPRSMETGLPLTPPPLSFAQQRLWFLDQLAPGNLFYNIPLAVEITGDLNRDAIVMTLEEIVRRHAVLRTNFKSINGTPVQIVNPELKVKIPVLDLSLLSDAACQSEVRRLAREEARQVFDLEKDRLIRAKLLYLGEHRHVFLLTLHHIVSDGWSMAIFFREIAELYPAFSQAKLSPLTPLQIQYYDFAAWQRAWLQGEQLDRQLDYWKKQLANLPSILDLPTDHPRPAVQSSHGATLSFELPLTLADKLNTISRQEGATLFMTLLAAFQVLLYRYSGQEDISIGTAIANRNRTEIEPLIGFFVNTLVMRTDLSGEPSFKELLKRVREVTLGAYAHQDLPFETLVEVLSPERNLSHTPLFQVAFALQNAPTSEAIRAVSKNSAGDLSFNLLEVDSGSAKFDMTLTMAETPNGMVGGLEYNRDLFEPETIQRLVKHYSILLEAITTDISQPITALPLLAEDELQMMLVDWNDSEMETPVDRCAHELFERRARQYPEVEAARFEGRSLSYRELDDKANKLALYLRCLGVGPNVLVGISTERSLEMVIGIMGVLKAGGAYVPLDPNYPSDRLAYMIQDSQVPVLLTQERLLDRLPLSQSNVEQESSARKRTPVVVCLDTAWESLSDQRIAGEEIAMDSVSDPDNLAYMIYTSGSTGKPKGTMLRHRGLCNLAEAQRQAFHITQNSRILQFSPLSFDASVWETFMALANGATLVLASQETLASGPDLLALLRDERITTVTLPPSVLRLYSAQEVSRESLPELLTVVSAGEACTPDIVQSWAPGREFFNAYGPTETTVCASMHLVKQSDFERSGKGAIGVSRTENNQQPPIGKPIANTKLFVLDRYLQPVPVGVPGELHVSGVSLAIGYRNQPELTALKFISNPFSGHSARFGTGDSRVPPGTKQSSQWTDRMYKTGDLVRYRPDGNIEFLGRIDQQVKVRGFRIELGEVETALAGFPELKEAIVIAQGSNQGDQRLVAFVVPAPGHTPDVNDMRTYLRNVLPEYMLPSAFIVLTELPLTPSGKVDRKALAAMESYERPELHVEFVAPRNEIEARLVEISGELLHLEKVGVNDNFFELGGHSLLATQFVSRIRDEFEVEVPLRKLFEMPTIAGIAEYISVERQIEVQKKQETSVAEAAQSGGPVSGSTIDRAKLLEMLQKIGDLSEEDVRALLNSKKQGSG